MRTRRLEVDDCADLVPLLDQLGYPTTEAALSPRIDLLLTDPRTGCWVADRDERIVGLVTGCLSWHLEFDGPAARLTALVVDESVRGQGVARLLVNVFEDWAREQGARRASLNSGVERDGAHAAYEKLGWSITGVRFSKDLSAPERQVPLSIL